MDVSKVGRTSACFKKLQVLNLGQQQEYQDGIFTYRCWTNVGPAVFRDYFSENISLHHYETRQASDFFVVHRRGTRAGFPTRFLGTQCVELCSREHLGD